MASQDLSDRESVKTFLIQSLEGAVQEHPEIYNQMQPEARLVNAFQRLYGLASQSAVYQQLLPLLDDFKSRLTQNLRFRRAL